MPHIHFTFPTHIQKELEKMVPLRERSQFVSQATEQALKMKRLRILLLSKKNVGTYSDLSPEKWLKRLRKKTHRVISFP